MKSAKYVIGFITILLFAIGIYLKLSDMSAKGNHVVWRSGGMSNTVISGNVVLFFAAIFAIGFYMILKIERKERLK